MNQIFEYGHALVVGVGADLPVTVKDAEAVRDQLIDPSRCAYPRNQVQFLTGPTANRIGILDGLDNLAKTVSSEDTVLVYISGHGTELPDFYLVPYGFKRSDLAGTAINQDEFTAKLRTIQAKKVLIVLDTCHAGGQAEAKGVTKSIMPQDALEELRQGSGRVVIASSRKDEVSWTGKPYSQFTNAFLEGLAGYGVFERDGYARILDIAMWVGRKVPERTNDQQHPIIKVSNLEDNFALAWYAAGSDSPKTLPWANSIVTINNDLAQLQIDTKRRMLANYRQNLMLIEERMSEYVEYTAIPLQLVKSRRQAESTIEKLEQELFHYN